MAVNEDDLRRYYLTKFPLETIKKWVSYNGNLSLDSRECAFWFSEDAFIRWKTINHMDLLLSSTSIRCPERMEIGPVYSHPIKDRDTVLPGEFIPVERELVFDVDSDDFKDIKCCCGNSEICDKCWVYMECAVTCLTQILKKNFGFKHILPVFSGRRGIHIWVCDTRARKLNRKIRESIVKYLNLQQVVESDGFTCPLLEEIFPICEKYFSQKIYENQRLFSDPRMSQQVQSIIGKAKFDEIRTNLLNINGTASKKWKAAVGDFVKTPNYKKLIISFTFPRLDENVTTILNHLLKSPFSVHPKSGLLSVPIPASKLSIFPKTWVPSLSLLLSGEEEANRVFNESISLLDQLIEDVTNEFA